MIAGSKFPRKCHVLRRCLAASSANSDCFIAVHVALITLLLVCNVAVAAEKPDFNREVRPILSDRCLACHGPDAAHREADLRLDEYDSATESRGDYAVIVPGNVSKSELISRITSDDHDLIMPPHHFGKPLTTTEVGVLKRWIESGAEFQPHWAYVEPKATPTPIVRQETWPANWIDQFILSRLEAEGLQPSAPADPATLVRRLAFDLTGLPPDPEIVVEYVSNPSDAAWAELVDSYLASDASAERLTMYWLDLVRFADTVGYHGDQDHNISPYRDWVIDAFASNMPFDQFAREQLAGDLLPNATIDQKTASGYNRLLQTTHEGGLQEKEYLAIYQADRVRNVSAVWMGATVGCAQCHDHKYDPYTAKDFYSMAAFFADLDEEQHFKVGTNSLPTKRPPEQKVLSRRDREELSRLQEYARALTQKIKADPGNPTLISQKKQNGFAIEDLQRSARLTMISAAKAEPRTVRLLPRGDWLDESGPIVQPAVPEFMGKAARKSARATRLDLANWLTDVENGTGKLTGRVFANRFWYLLMGSGIATLDDFGGQGRPPEHPELLDHLALEFVSDWDVRHVLRMIATSRTYRQSSMWTPELQARDPSNALYARQSSYRLPAEMVRDAALQISGLLVNKVGGASVKPYQPAGYYRHLNFPTRKYTHDADSRQWRRGLYVHWQRQFLHPMMKAFDAPSREECTAERPRSNTPLAALTLLNDPTFVEASRALATRILTESPENSFQSRLNFAMSLAVGRLPEKAEVQIFETLLNDATAFFEANPNDASKAVEVGLSKKNQQINRIELAAWTSVARTLLNLDEVITRN